MADFPSQINLGPHSLLAEAELHPVAEAFLQAHLENPWLIACSGGADSVFLTLIMLAKFPQQAPFMHLVHVDHGLRGSESDADAAFTGSLAARLKLPFTLKKLKATREDEAHLRTLRYEACREAMDEIGSTILLLGHHRDDVLESQIIQLCRGGGPASLAAPRPVQAFSDGHARVRPLLNLDKADLLHYLKESGVPYREDSSNQSGDYKRNAVRHEIVHQLKNIFGEEVTHRAADARELQEEQETAWEVWLDSLDLDISDPAMLRGMPLRGYPMALWRRAFFRWWNRHRKESPPGGRSLRQMLNCWYRGVETGSFPVSTDLILKVNKHDLCLEKSISWHSWKFTPVRLAPGMECFWPDGARISAQIAGSSELSKFLNDRPPPVQEVMISVPPMPLWLRTWRRGDAYRPLNAPGTRKLQDMFVDSKISREQRERIPVFLSAAGEVIWVPGFPPAHGLRLTSGMKEALRLTYHTG